MGSTFIIRDRENKPYALVEASPKGTKFYAASTSAESWAKWMSEEYADRKVTREQLVATIDNAMSIDNSANPSVVDEIKKRTEVTEKPVAETKSDEGTAALVPVISLMDIQLSEFSDDMWRNAVQYKALSFIADQNKSSFTYEVKRTRAMWDPTLAVPGTDRRGGWRCPVGTRYGGQITDRFGRNCGWGVARRLANEISDLGERLENIGDKRRARRVARRNERMARRLAEGGAIERGARAIGDALDFTGMGGRQRGRRQRIGQDATVKPGRIERAAGRLAEAIDPDRGRSRRPAAGLENGGRGVLMPEDLGPPRQRVGVARRRPNLRASEQRRMEREIVEPNAPRTRRPGARRPAAGLENGGRGVLTPEELGPPAGNRPAPRPRPNAQVRPARPRQPRRVAPEAAPREPRPRVPRDNVSGVPVPAGAPNARESLDAYKNRKYNEHQAEVRRIRERGGNAGFLRREEWEQFHGAEVEAAWRRRNPDAPNEPQQPRPRPAAPRRPANNRNRRRTAATQNGARPANRRPRQEDQPEPVQPRAPRSPRTARVGGGEGGGVDRAQPATGRVGTRNRRAGDPLLVRGKQHDGRIGNIGEDGLPDVRRVEVGHNNINTKDDAVRHLADGGNIKDVPDDFVFEAIKANAGTGKRFSHRKLGGGGNVNGQLDVYKDRDGKEYIVKYARGRYRMNEDVNEIAGNNIAGRLGFQVGEFRFAGPTYRDQHGQGRPIIFEHADNYIDGTVRPPNGTPPWQDRVGATMLDYLILNTDRHPGNYFVVEQNGKKRFVPIDPSLGFNAREFNGAMADESGLQGWLRSHAGGRRNNFVSKLKEDVAQGRVSRDDIVRVVAQLQENLRKSEEQKSFRSFANDIVNAAGSGTSARPGGHKITDAAQRMAFVQNVDPRRFVDLMLA